MGGGEVNEQIDPQLMQQMQQQRNPGQGRAAGWGLGLEPNERRNLANWQDNQARQHPGQQSGGFGNLMGWQNPQEGMAFLAQQLAGPQQQQQAQQGPVEDNDYNRMMEQVRAAQMAMPQQAQMMSMQNPNFQGPQQMRLMRQQPQQQQLPQMPPQGPLGSMLRRN